MTRDWNDGSRLRWFGMYLNPIHVGAGGAAYIISNQEGAPLKLCPFDSAQGRLWAGISVSNRNLTVGKTPATRVSGLSIATLFPPHPLHSSHSDDSCSKATAPVVPLIHALLDFGECSAVSRCACAPSIR